MIKYEMYSILRNSEADIIYTRVSYIRCFETIEEINPCNFMYVLICIRGPLLSTVIVSPIYIFIIGSHGTFLHNEG